MAGVIMTAQKDTWGTPDWLADAAAEAFGGAIDLDPCGNPDRLLSQARLTVVQPPTEGPAIERVGMVYGNGLTRSWAGKRVYVNPPYGKPLGKWLEKCEQEGDKIGDASVIALVPSHTARKAWQRAAQSSRAICFLNKRVKFHGAANGAGFGSCLMLFSENFQHLAGFMGVFKRHGFVLLNLWTPPGSEVKL